MSDSSSDQPSPPQSHDWTMETPKAFPSQSCPEPDSVPFTGATISNETVLPSIETEHDEDPGDCPVCALEANMRDPCAKPGPLDFDFRAERLIDLVFKTLSPEIPHQTRNTVCRLVAQRCSCDGVWNIKSLDLCGGCDQRRLSSKHVGEVRAGEDEASDALALSDAPIAITPHQSTRHNKRIESAVTCGQYSRDKTQSPELPDLPHTFIHMKRPNAHNLRS
ncbi:hypothetical protein RB213_001790 [Colletotrichum asianum]